MQLPILSGVVVRDGAFAASYPVNLEPRALDTGVSKGQLVTTRGAVSAGTGPGTDRGGIVWNDILYRVMGSNLVSVSAAGVITTLGDVGTDGLRCGFDYSFDRLAVRSARKLYYWSGTTLTEVTDPDLGAVVDMLWMDGYFVTTDGTSLVATELLDPTSIDPLKYGSAEEDPDPVTGVLKFREELYGIGRYSIEVYQNVGGLNFPFQVIKGATLPYGCVGPNAKCQFPETFAFVGGGKDQPVGVIVYTGGGASRISNKDIEDLIAAEPDVSLIELEARQFGEEQQIILHLSAQSIGIALHTSAAGDAGAWFFLQSGRFEPYRLRNAVLCYGKHYVGDTDSSSLGTLSTDDDRHFGDKADWRFDSALVYNGTAIVLSEIELIGQFPTTETAIFMSLTRDGVQWSNEVARILTGRRDERVMWRPAVRFPAIGSTRWRGTGKVAIARAEMQAEALET
jgi:Phage stabilisation protein